MMLAEENRAPARGCGRNFHGNNRQSGRTGWMVRARRICSIGGNRRILSFSRSLAFPEPGICTVLANGQRICQRQLVLATHGRIRWLGHQFFRPRRGALAGICDDLGQSRTDFSRSRRHRSNHGRAVRHQSQAPWAGGHDWHSFSLPCGSAPHNCTEPQCCDCRPSNLVGASALDQLCIDARGFRTVHIGIEGCRRRYVGADRAAERTSSRRFRLCGMGKSPVIRCSISLDNARLTLRAQNQRMIPVRRPTTPTGHLIPVKATKCRFL